MNNGAFGENFPYSNFHDLNMDWIIKIAKDFLDQYTHIQEIIEQGKTDIETLTTSGLEQLQDKADTLTALLQQWYDTHSEDIADQLADALNDLNEWYTTHQGYLEQYLQDSITAFGTAADAKAAQTIASIPSDYTTLSTTVAHLLDAFNSENAAVVAGYGYISSRTGELIIAGETYQYTEKLRVYPGDTFSYSGVVSDGVFIIAAYENENDSIAIINKSVPGVATSAALLSGTYTVPEGVNYIRFCGFANSTFVLKKMMSEELRLMFEKLEKVINDGVLSPMIENYGFISASDGEIVETGSTYSFSKMYKVNPGDMYEYSLGGSSGVLIIAAYEDYADTAAQLDKSVIGPAGGRQASGIYTVPSGIHYIRVCGYIANLMLFRRNTKEKTISILFVGNSLTQDGIAYLPYLLKNYYPEINFKLYMWYMGGYTLAQQYDAFIDETNAANFSVAENSASWTNYTNSRSMRNILETYKFDIVCMQEYFNYKTSYTEADLEDWNNCQSYIKTHYTGGNGLEFITLFHAPLRSNATTVFNRTLEGNKLILQKTIADDMLPIGIGIYNALSTSLDDLGDMSHLSNDGTHAQEGIPCLLQTYVAACWLLDRLGMARNIYANPIRITESILNSINVPDPNPNPYTDHVITGDTTQNTLAQEVAIKAYKQGKYIVNKNIYIEPST